MVQRGSLSVIPGHSVFLVPSCANECNSNSLRGRAIFPGRVLFSVAYNYVRMRMHQCFSSLYYFYIILTMDELPVPLNIYEVGIGASFPVDIFDPG